jgi:hypothetical protein
VAGHLRFLNLDFGGDLGDLARTLCDGTDLEGVAGDLGDRATDALVSDRELVELPAEFLVGHVLVGSHGAVTVSRPPPRVNAAWPNRNLRGQLSPC